jgi:hypothetical protein
MEQSEIWQHVKSGGLYRVVGECLLEKDLTHLTIYKSLMNGQQWVRPSLEFHDGRFRIVSLKSLSVLLTPDEWLEQPEFIGVTIMDPDGWDRKNFAESWAEPLTIEEMQNRTVRCTVSIAPDSPMHPRNIWKEHTNG